MELGKESTLICTRFGKRALSLCGCGPSDLPLVSGARKGAEERTANRVLFAEREGLQHHGPVLRRRGSMTRGCRCPRLVLLIRDGTFCDTADAEVFFRYFFFKVGFLFFCRLFVHGECRAQRFADQPG